MLQCTPLSIPVPCEGLQMTHLCSAWCKTKINPDLNPRRGQTKTNNNNINNNKNSRKFIVTVKDSSLVVFLYVSYIQVGMGRAMRRRAYSPKMTGVPPSHPHGVSS